MGWPEEGRSLDGTEWEYIFQRLLGRQAAASLENEAEDRQAELANIQDVVPGVT